MGTSEKSGSFAAKCLCHHEHDRSGMIFLAVSADASAAVSRGGNSHWCPTPHQEVA